MPTFLFTHNPSRWDWADLQDCIKEIESSGWCHSSWSCNTKQIHKGDLIYLIRLGTEPKGIFASGWAISDWYEGPHWDETKEAEGKKARYVDVVFNAILDPDNEDILPRKVLDNGILKQMHRSVEQKPHLRKSKFWANSFFPETNIFELR
ncbi:MAG TPA: EVE domain-containing protein [Candidatus Deferrimicrobium sp.]|nr:EVE domain-containing protein [Candidatus Deferrimicrobium sp.]